jgi:opacity protein-like surface antigen
MLGSATAWAECRDNFAVLGVPLPGLAALLPFGQGGSVNSLVSVINTVNTSFLTNTSAFVSAPGGPRPDQQGGGAWVRGMAGTVDNNNTGVTTIPSVFNPVPVPVTGSQTCNTTTRLDYTGFQVGHDISILNGGGSGANWHFGVTAGYMEARVKDVSSAPPVPTFKGDTEVPFAGIYTAFSKGGFFADAQARWDFYQNHIVDPANSVPGQDFNARGFSLTGNLGYNVAMGGGWFIEPSGGVIWSRVKVDSFNVPGPFFPGFGFVSAGSVQIQDVESLLGRASLTVGTNFTSGGVAWQPYFTASGFHEFADDVKTTLTPDPTIPIVSLGFAPGTLTTSRVGTYGQLALGTAAAIVNTGWLGYARVDYRFGENIEGWGVNAGLRYQFTPDPRRGSIKDGPALAAHSYNWTGPYVGGFVGRVWGDEDWRFVGPGTRVVVDFGGYFAGGQAGYNVQLGKIVVGIEGDYGWSNANGGKQCPGFFFTCQAEVDGLASVTARLGYSVGRALFYAKGGWAGGDVTATGTLNTAPGAPIFAVTPVVATKWVNGWTLGGGMEFALTDRWSAKAEYMHYDLGEERFVVSTLGGVPADIADITTRGDTVRIGVNYHFGPRCCEGPLK